MFTLHLWVVLCLCVCGASLNYCYLRGLISRRGSGGNGGNTTGAGAPVEPHTYQSLAALLFTVRGSSAQFF